LNYSYAASEGTITGSDSNATYNSSSVSFDERDRSRPQSKTVTITATVADSKNGSGTNNTTVTVNYPAKVEHVGDIVFSKGSARVNNCGKRALIEHVYPMLAANDNFDVVLVGHTDSNETPKGRAARKQALDRERVLNTAAVLSGGGGTCTSLPSSRIKGVWVGDKQDSEFKPASCEVSTQTLEKLKGERKGADVDASEAKNRRVEIWLVPKGLPLPPAASDAKDLPEGELKKIGCPK
jgi:flagellar motor protein MotB